MRLSLKLLESLLHPIWQGLQFHLRNLAQKPTSTTPLMLEECISSCWEHMLITMLQVTEALFPFLLILFFKEQSYDIKCSDVVPTAVLCFFLFASFLTV